MTCPAEFHEDGQVIVCERAVGHLPSLWHLNRTVGIVWYWDRRPA